MEDISRHMKDKKMLGNSLHRFTKCKSCMTNPVALYNEMTGFTDEEGAMNVTYLYFSYAFYTVSHNIHVAKQKRHCFHANYKVDINWLDSWPQRTVISKMNSN